jgi:RHS repeat-associated protein
VLGNWSTFIERSNATTQTLNQSRTHNKVNEIDTDDDDANAAGASITASTGTNWADPEYDPAGNMERGPLPSSPGTKRHYVYDAWNRLVSIDDDDLENPTTLTAYEYDGLGRRIRQLIGPGGVDHILHSYYNAEWQELEVRKEVSGTEDPDPLEQLVWHPYYIDALAVRWYDADTNPASVTEQYAIHDANYNVTALVGTTGTVLERYEYDPYGKLTVLTSTFTADGDNKSDSLNGYTYTGRKLDVTAATATTGHYYYRHRVYDPGLGRFVQRDPMEYVADTCTLYEYGSGAPVVVLDTWGLYPIKIRCMLGGSHGGGSTITPERTVDCQGPAL